MRYGIQKVTVGLTCFLLYLVGCYPYSGEIDPALSDLRITEIHYHPLPESDFPADSCEFVEIKNTGDGTVDLSTCSFTQGISYVFPRGARVAADGFYVIASNRNGFMQRYGFAPDGVYDKKLGNSADTLVLTDDYTEEEVLLQMYADSGDWSPQADGKGYSLVPIEVDPPPNPTGPDRWHRSRHLHGSPGVDDSVGPEDPALSGLRITEIHYHPLDPDSVEEDSPEFIELKNTGTSVVPLSKVAFTGGIRYTFPEGTRLDPGAFYVIASSHNGFTERYDREPDGVYERKLSNSGETLVLEAPASVKVLLVLLSVTYGVDDPWPVEADGDGYSLVPVSINPPADQDDPDRWCLSYAIDGSPFADDPASRR